MRGKLKVHVEHCYEPDPEAVRRAIAAIIRFSDARRAAARAEATAPPESA